MVDKCRTATAAGSARHHALRQLDECLYFRWHGPALREDRKNGKLAARPIGQQHLQLARRDRLPGGDSKWTEDAAPVDGGLDATHTVANDHADGHRHNASIVVVCEFPSGAGLLVRNRVHDGLTPGKVLGPRRLAPDAPMTSSRAQD